MIPRQLAAKAKQLASWFPVVSVTGPRQSGKSTLVRATFPDYDYVNLEDPQLRRSALDDPVGFIRNRPNRLIIDEAQYAPELFSMIQVVSDEHSQPGQYILSGSQNFLLQRTITQSLAGRVGLLKLLPLSFAEASEANEALTTDDFMFTGGFPRIYTTGMPSQVFFDNYVDTYVERDVAGYLDVTNLVGFRTFLRLCAANSGNLTNYSRLAKDADIDVRTAKSWLSILESSYVLFRLPPYHTNGRKRLTKTSKLYFYDTGLLCHLMGFDDLHELLLDQRLGAVFENLIVAETLKRHLNLGEDPHLYFYRDESKIEVDLLDFTDTNRHQLIEIKSSQTYQERFARHLGQVGEFLSVPTSQRYVTARVEASFQAKHAYVYSARDWLFLNDLHSVLLAQ